MVYVLDEIENLGPIDIGEELIPNIGIEWVAMEMNHHTDTAQASISHLKKHIHWQNVPSKRELIQAN